MAGRKILLIFMVLIIGMCGCSFKTMTDKQIVKSYCMTHYSSCKIVYTKHVPTIRTNKHKVYVEIVKSVSIGNKWGKDKDGYIIKYNVNVKKGKHVKSYLIYNPKNNSIDDVVAVVDNKKIRWLYLKKYKINCEKVLTNTYAVI